MIVNQFDYNNNMKSISQENTSNNSRIQLTALGKTDQTTMQNTVSLMDTNT
uniref:Uncharacterized protein n=1 Tax=Arion vulgaris TaxID=1028688 RepID=A0A0B7AV57_9EUPU